MSCRSGIPYHEIVPSFPHQFHDVVEQVFLRDAGCASYIVPDKGIVEVGKRGYDVINLLAETVHPFFHNDLGRDLEGGESRCVKDRGLVGADGLLKDIREGRGRVAGQDHGLFPAPAMCMAMAAAQVVLPTPPFPPTKISFFALRSKAARDGCAPGIVAIYSIEPIRVSVV